MEISALGEFGLISRLHQRLKGWGVAQRPGLVLGIGDDAAVYRPAGGLQVITTDALVEGVHFRLGQATWEDLGWKALAINLSDLAAMGAEPDLALVSLALPPSTQVEDIDAFCDGLAQLAREHGVALAGGNMARSPLVQVHVTVTGHLPRGSGPLSRSQAKTGEAIAVTGSLGGSAGWLRLEPPLPPEAASALRRAHYRPRPRLAEGRLLRKAGVSAAIDVSDGLADDLGKLCQASGMAARVELARIPVHPDLAGADPATARELALYGGEDYELLFTALADTVGDVAARASLPVTVIGAVVSGPPGQVWLVEASGIESLATPRGWNHFSR